MLHCVQAKIHILREFVQAAGELLEVVTERFQLAREIADLGFELLDAHFLAGRRCRIAARGRSARRDLAVVDLAFNVRELLLQPVDLVRQGLDVVLGLGRRHTGDARHSQTDGSQHPGL